MTPSDAQQLRERLEGAIQDYALRFFRPRDPAVERARFPDMVAIYWSLAGGVDGLPPTQQQFGRTVLNRIRQRGELTDVPDETILARPHRAYPSFVRQHHFELVLRAEHWLVCRADLLDLQGFDFVLVEDGLAFGVGLSVDTPRAHYWAQEKRHRHNGALQMPVLDLYLDLEDAYACGPFLLHCPSQVEEIRAWMDRERAHRKAIEALV